MANNFKPWVDSPTAGQQVQSASVFATDTQRVNGFKAGDPASALRVNSALRQANIVVASLMQMCDDIKTLPDGLSLMSTVTQIKNAIKAAIDQLDATVLASAKSYTDTREGVIDGKITNVQNQVTSNKNELDALEPRVDNLEDDVAQNLLDVQTALENITNGTTTVAKATNAEHAKNADTATNAEHAKSADTATDADNASTASTSIYLNGNVITVTLGGELSSSGNEAQIELFATGTAAEQLSVGSVLKYNGEIAEITEFDGDTYTLTCKKDGEFYSKLGQQIQVLTLIDYDKIINAINTLEILYSGNANSGTIQLSKPLAVGDKICVCYGGDYQYFTITQSINTNTPTVTKTILKQRASGTENYADLQIHSIEMVMSVGQKEITLKPIHTVIKLDTYTSFAAKVEEIGLSSDFSITEIARLRA